MITNRSSCFFDTMSDTSTTATQSKAATRIVELPVNELDALISRVEQAKKAQLTLSPEDCDLLLNAVLTLASMQERLSHNELTISKLKKLMGMVRSSEKMKDLFPDEDTDNNKGHKDKRDSRDTRSGQKASGTPRKRRPEPKAPTTYKHALEGLSKGDPCPACPGGKLHKYEPAVLIRIVGNEPLSSERHLSERLRCSSCG